MTDEKLKTALREALEEFFQQKGSCSEECADFVAAALARRNVIVATAADSYISSEEVWDSWRDKVAVILSQWVKWPSRYGIANQIMHLLFPAPVDGPACGVVTLEEGRREAFERVRRAFLYAAQNSEFKGDHLQVFSRTWWELHDSLQALLAAEPTKPLRVTMGEG